MTATDPPVPTDTDSRTNHVCWLYTDQAAFRARAVTFLDAGLRAGERLEYLASGSRQALSHDLAALPELRSMLERGELTVRSLDDRYGRDEAVDPQAPAAAYRAATEEALAAGYTGLRVVAEATALVRTPEQREAFARYEHTIDRYMVRQPFSALCAYDEAELGPGAAELACLHPQVSGGATGFRWYAGRDAAVHLAGEVDLACEEIFDRTVARTIPMHRGAPLVVDAQHLGFIDHRGLLALERQARQAGIQVMLATGLPVVRSLTKLLPLKAVVPVPSG